MMTSKKWMWLLAGALTLSGAGCHELQRHRLDRWNRVPDSMPSDAYNFSIPDPPVPEAAMASEKSQPSCSSNPCVE